MWVLKMISNEIKDLMPKLVSMTEQEWGAYAFSRDPIHKRLSPQLQQEMIQKANLCGRKEAQKLQNQFGAQHILQLADTMGLDIARKDSFGTDNFITFAQFQFPNHITLFMKNITAAQTLIEQNNIGGMLQHVNIEQLLTAHELFHFIESKNAQLYTKTKIVLWRIGSFQYKSGLICLGEIAAMAFAAELLHLNYSPYVFDVVLPWSQNEAQCRKLYQNILQFKIDKGD